jgi:hypothetical protein
MASPGLKASVPTNRTLASRVRQILLHPGLLEIAFQLGRIQVTGMMFPQVAQAVTTGRIKCWTVAEFNSQGRDDLVGGRRIEAEYKTTPNAMVFQRSDYGITPSEEQTIVHEAVHAALDLSVARGRLVTLSIEDEAAATLASAFYIKLCNPNEDGFRMGGGGHAEALELAEQALKYPGNYTVTNGRYMFTEIETEALRYAVATARKFNKHIGSDGLPTDASGAIYTYEGVPVCGKSGCK